MIERSSEEMAEVIASLRNWALGHPEKDRPFMVVRDRAFTPATFYKAVEDQSDYAEPFLTYLFEQASLAGIRPKTLIDRESFKHV
jgi:hypothetical protein